MSKRLSRNEIMRWVGTNMTESTRRRGGSSAVGGGGVSAQWVDDHYISKEFFGAIFKILNGQGSSATEIEPNDTDTIDANPNTVNIEAMFGLWTEKFFSALGQGSGEGSGGGGATTLAQLNDVILTGLASGDLLKYNGTHWVNVTIATLLTDYATKQWCNATFVTQSSASDMATQSWVNLQGFIKTRPTSIWGQNWPVSNSPISGNMSDVGNISFDQSGRNIGSIAYFDTTNGRLGIGSSPGNYTLDVDGDCRINSNLSVDGWIDCDDLFCNDLYTYGTLNFNSTVNIGTYCSILEDSSGYLALSGGSGVLLTGGDVGVGTSSPNYKLDVNGDAHADNFISGSNVNQASDARLKDIINHFTLEIESIANASLIHYTWKDGRDNRIHVGGIAQEWQKILPESVYECKDGMLSMDYGVISYSIAISLARKVKDQQEEIETLKKKNAEMEKRLARLEKMFAIIEED